MGRRLIAIDPATKDARIGLARFDDDELIHCGHEWYGHACDVLVIEKPQVYMQSSWKGDPNDLIDVAFAAGCIAGRLPHVTLLTPKPAEWKGQVPKDIHNARVISKLNDREAAVFRMYPGPAHLKHNVIDAIGLGLWFLKRM